MNLLFEKNDSLKFPFGVGFYLNLIQLKKNANNEFNTLIRGDDLLWNFVYVFRETKINVLFKENNILVYKLMIFCFFVFINQNEFILTG